MNPELETDAQATGLSLHEYRAILRRRRAIILQAFVLITVVGLIITLLTKPVYHASAKLLVDGPSYNLNTVDNSNPLSQLLAVDQEQTVETQVEVLQTQPLLDQVTRQVGPAALSVAHRQGHQRHPGQRRGRQPRAWPPTPPTGCWSCTSPRTPARAWTRSSRPRTSSRRRATWPTSGSPTPRTPSGTSSSSTTSPT